MIDAFDSALVNINLSNTTNIIELYAFKITSFERIRIDPFGIAHVRILEIATIKHTPIECIVNYGCSDEFTILEKAFINMALDNIHHATFAIDKLCEFK